jgi:dienelactone hydrolase
MMRIKKYMIVSLWIWLVCAIASGQEVVSFAASDDVQVFGKLYSAGDTTKPIILLFHQADYNKEEYSEIAPRLVEAGFNALAVDQRSGGNAYGGENLTVNALGKSTGYLEALPDLEAALAWAKGNGYQTIIVWGSSYSSSLVFLLAAEHPEIAGVLSFSPGEYFSKLTLVQDAAAKVTVPVFITSDGSSGEVTKAHTIFAAVASKNKVEFEPDGIGFHGSFALLQGPLKEKYWTAVLAFLEGFNLAEN